MRRKKEYEDEVKEMKCFFHFMLIFKINKLSKFTVFETNYFE